MCLLEFLIEFHRIMNFNENSKQELIFTNPSQLNRKNGSWLPVLRLLGGKVNQPADLPAASAPSRRRRFLARRRTLNTRARRTRTATRATPPVSARPWEWPGRANSLSAGLRWTPACTCLEESSRAWRRLPAALTDGEEEEYVASDDGFGGSQRREGHAQPEELAYRGCVQGDQAKSAAHQEAPGHGGQPRTGVQADNAFNSQCPDLRA